MKKLAWYGSKRVDDQKPTEWADFTPKGMVSWFSPPTLARAAVREILTRTIGQYGNRRDSQRAFQCTGRPELMGEERWIDFVADTGDGFASTFTVARTMASDLEDDEGASLESGSVVLFGGDQVYPDAHDNAYENRFRRPFEEAYRYPSDPDEPTRLAYAIPGNHDWYDGLQGFVDLFCRPADELKFSAFRTPQRRSYWALSMPGDWWFFGLDWHLDLAMDLAQESYFDEILKSMRDQAVNIVLIVPNPVWLQSDGDHERFRRFQLFVDKCATGNRKVPLVLTGDLHCYARYRWRTPSGTTQLVMAGGGGAYLYPTHSLPEKRTLPGANPTTEHPDNEISLEEGKYPDHETSKSMSSGSTWFLLRNPAIAFFLIGPIYLLLSYIVFPTESIEDAPNAWRVLRDARFSVASLGATFHDVINGIYSLAPSIILPGVLVAAAGWARAASMIDACEPRKTLTTALGVLHGLAHLIAAFLTVWLLATFRYAANLRVGNWGEYLFIGATIAFAFGRHVPSKVTWTIVPFQLVVLAVLYLAGPSYVEIPLVSEQIIVLGGTLGTVILGFYLWTADRCLHAHANEVFACQSIPDCKNFVRLHISRGEMNVYAIGIDKAVPVEDWKWGKDGYQPASGAPINERAKIIEHFTIRDRGDC